uniref:Uncharacterized protein n=1 Tax=Tanacetum cinerariifolium TaxID=118510 RepID=A0A6L2MRS0_TANCI|nr:hypothetical protein [Tanacetum cinerariifolium]
MSDMTMLLNDFSYIPPNNEHNEPTQGDIGETSNEPTQAICNEFEELYASANEELYPGCDYVTRLDFMEKFTYFKVKGKLNDSIFNEMLEFFQNVFPISKGYKIPSSYYATKKTFKMIRLGYESIHACEHDCCLFRGKENKDLNFCPMCNTSRWKDSNTPRKKVPKKVFCYFLIIPRLQCLFKSSHTAKEMIWHATGKCTKHSKMQHSVDGRAWKKFDTMYLDFRKEPRNVRLGLAADGFNPFGNLTQAYSMQDKTCKGWASKWLVARPNQNREVLEASGCIFFHTRESKKFCQFIKGVKLPDGFGSCLKHKVTDKDTNITDLKSHEYHIMMQHLLPYGLQQYLPNKIAKPITELCSLFKKICYAPLMEDDMLKALIKFISKQRHEGRIHRLVWVVDNDKDIEVSTTNELFILACRPTWTPISVNSCVVNGVRYVMNNRDECNTTQNNGNCSPTLMEKCIMVSLKKFSSLKDDPDIISFDNSSDLPLFASLNDLDNGTFHKDGQSIEVNAPTYIIDVLNEDDDIVDDEDAIPHDLTDFDNKYLINVDDDGVDKVYSSEEDD